jgi:hypothetical protein
MAQYDRADILDKTNYQFDLNGKESDTSSKKSWWIIGILIGFIMNFIAFLTFYVFHKRKSAEKQML